MNDGPNSLVACKLGDLIDYRLLLVQMMLLLHYGRMASECTTAEFRSRLNRGQLGHRGITAENIEKSQHTDLNEDTTNESASVACSNVRL